MDPGHLLQIIQPMLAGFKLEIAKMRSEGATQAEIDQCSMSSKRSMRLTTRLRASSLLQFSGKLLGSLASGHKLTIVCRREAPGLHTGWGFFWPWGRARLAAEGSRNQCK